jgi:hypothetical protein
MLDLDTSALPSGAVGWARFLQAVEQADPTDETEWLEFKAGTDPTSKDGRAALAKAIVAFANRDPERAGRWLGGYAVVLVGIEPGSVSGTVPVDPAQIHDGVQSLIAEPAPAWDLSYVTYGETQILVITVAPPRHGDPVYCIGKSSGVVQDGNIYVRKPGKSSPASSADVRRLVERVGGLLRPELDIAVTVAGASGYAVAKAVWHGSELDGWVSDRRARLLEPLIEEEKKKARQLQAPLSLSLSRFALDAGIARESIRSFTETPEPRTPEQYREEVDTYLSECRAMLPHLATKVSTALLPAMKWVVVNRTLHNLEGVEVRVHVEGEVYYRPKDPQKPSIVKRLPRAPRLWGPVPIPNPYDNLAIRGATFPSPPRAYIPDLRPRPIIEHGGSVTVTFPEVHLRPEAEVVLDREHVLVLGETQDGPLRATWIATATNVSGTASGELQIEVDPEPVSLDELL